MQLRRRRPASSNSAPPHRPDQGLKTAALGLVERVAAAADGHQRAQRRGLRGGGRHLVDLTWAGSSRRWERPTPRGRARPTPACRSAAGCPVRPSRRCSAPSTPARRLLGQRLLREPADLRPAALAPDALWVVQIFPRTIDTEPRSPRRHRRPAGRADGQPVAGAGGRRDRDDQPAGARRVPRQRRVPGGRHRADRARPRARPGFGGGPLTVVPRRPGRRRGEGRRGVPRGAAAPLTAAGAPGRAPGRPRGPAARRARRAAPRARRRSPRTWPG